MDEPGAHVVSSPELVRSVSDPRAAPSVLAALAANLDPFIRGLAAEHPACPASVLVTLSQDPSWRVRLHAAMSPSADGRLLNSLSSDRTKRVRIVAEARIAGNVVYNLRGGEA